MAGQFRNRSGKPRVASFRDSAADEELVAAAKSGDELAFEILVNRYERRIFALALRYAHIREDAEDIVQQTFQQAFVHLQNFEGKSSFSTWATRIAINQALMLLRTRQALREVPIDDPSSDERTIPALELVDDRRDPEASYMHSEVARILAAAMRQLSPGMRRAIELRDLAELSTRETAGHMDLSVAAVKGRLFQARKKLGKALSCRMQSRRIPRNGTSVFTNDAGHISLAHLKCARN